MSVRDELNRLDEEMEKAVKYAHLRGVKVYVAMNTLVNDSELEDGAEYAELLYEAGVDAVIAIGCVIRGDTPHDRYICQGVTYGLARLNAVQDVPVIYGLITTLDMQQAEERAGGKMGNKGDECAVTAIKMIDYARKVLELHPKLRF